jgi:hypothetical protein
MRFLDVRCRKREDSPFACLKESVMFKRRIFACLLAILAIVFFLTATESLSARPAQGIGSIGVTATPHAFRGPCPAHLRFSARIEVDHFPMTLNYQWERSDGAKGPVRVVRVPSARTKTVTVVDTWQMGRKGDRLDVWEKVRVRSGNADTTSREATVTVDCR